MRLHIPSWFALPLALAASTLPASAATFEVNRLDDLADPQPDDGICSVEPMNPVSQCTLRAAMQTANALPGHDTIVLASGGIYQLNLSGDGGAEVGDLDIGDDLHILGFTGSPPADPGSLPLIDALGMNDRIFTVGTDVEAALRGLRLRGGKGPLGGAVYSLGDLSVDLSLFDYNVADWGGAVFASGGGLLRITDSHFESNRANHSGAAIGVGGGAVEILRSSFRDNRGDALTGTTLSFEGTDVLIADSSLDGTPLGPPLAGFDSAIGIGAWGDSLILRNVTLTDYTAFGLLLGGLGADPGSPRVRVANSILSTTPGGVGCSATGPDPAAADVLIAYSMVESHTGCSQFYSEVRQNSPQLAPSVQDPGRVTWSRAPLGVFSNLTDNGIPPDRSPPANAPELACTATDQRGSPRPVDGNGDDVARCDFGAVEAAEPPTFIVDTAGDAVDDVPGDGLCETLSMECSLRAAVMEANALPDVQRIRFTPGLDPIELIAPPHPAAAGGDLDIGDALIISGERIDGQPGTKIVQGVAGERVFDVLPGFAGPLLLRNLELSGGDSGAAFGGALRVMDGEVIVQWSRFSDNHSPMSGGAIAVQGGLAVLQDSDLHGNSADERGGAVFVGSGATFGLVRSSVWSNVGFDGILPVAAIEAEPGAVLSIGDSTIAANSAGILSDHASFFGLFGSTVAHHVGDGVSAAFGAFDDVALVSNIVWGSGSVSAAKGLAGFGIDCRLTDLDLANVLVHSHQLSGDGSCTAGSPTSFWADPLLGELVPVAGHPTRVLWPRHDAEAVSPALDVAPAESCNRPDQIGQNRPVDLPDYDNVNGPCDLGAVERQTDRLFRDGFESAVAKASAHASRPMPAALSKLLARFEH